VLLKLNLEDPLAPKIAGDLEKRGFLFCGVFPAFQEDRLALIYLNNCIVNFEEIHVADPMGEALVAYIQHLGKEREEEEA
jgi:hypothetical protein